MINQFTFNFKEIVIDEVALEGLEGITLELLWRRVEKRISTSLTEKIKVRIWNFAIRSQEISFYRLPEPRVRFEIVDRFTLVDEETGYLKDPDDYPDGPYEYCPVKGDYGSCKDYKTRKLVEKSDKLSLEQIIQNYGDTFVLVASLKERWQSIAPDLPITVLETLPPERYCMLELIGKGRQNGQMSVGKSNLLKLSKDPKLLFYNRKPMQEIGLITSVVLTQRCFARANKAILIRLTRFHKSRIASQPKIGKQHDLVQYLKAKPNYSECVDTMMREKMITAKQVKKIRKSSVLLYLYEESQGTEASSSAVVKTARPGTGSSRRLRLMLESDQSSDSEGEGTGVGTDLPCQYKVGVGLLRQAYERILDSGLKGLTQVELCQILGIEFYTSRTISRVFKKRNIVREFIEDTGRQRATRFIAVAATGVVDEQYAQQKQQLLDYLSTTKKEAKPCDLSTDFLALNTYNEEVPMKKIKLDLEEREEVPKKKIKLEIGERHDVSALIEPDAITEIKTIEGLESVKGYSASLQDKGPGPTMRQLKYANGIIKVTRERGSVAGFQTLSNLVAKEIKESPMDAKALKTFVQKLVADGQLKVFTLKWPGKSVYTNLICAPHVKTTDPIVQSKYKEICMRALITAGQKKRGRPPDKVHKPLAMLVYPRYMKVRQLHMFLTQTILFTEGIQGSDLPSGFVSLLQIIPEMAVELAVGLMSAVSVVPLMHLKLDSLLKMKLKDIPLNVYGELLQSKSLQASLRENLKTLATFGLIQLCHKISTSIDQYTGLLQNVFYVNRNARLIDTTGTWPREDADPSSLEKTFYFDTYDDVSAYWKTLYEVSMSTNVVGRVKTRYNPVVPALRNPDEVLQCDDGRIYGDGRGAAGLDSVYFVELQRNWETLNIVNFNPMPVKFGKQTRKPKRAFKPKPVSQLKTRKPKKRPSGRKRNLKKPPLEAGRKRRPALPMGKWETWEDEVIMLCKTGMTIMSPTSQPGCLSTRNMVAKDILTIRDKAKVANICHRRTATLEPNSILAHTSECLLNEVRRRRQTMAKYGGLLKKLRLANSHSMTKYIKEARIPLMELVMILYKIARSESFNKITPCVAQNLEDFHKDFTITTATSNRALNLYRAPSECDIPVSTIKEAVVLSLALKIDRELDEATSRKIYNILGEYPEKHIRVALEHLRKSGVVAAKEKIVNSVLSRLTFEDAIQVSSPYQATVATYRLSVSYARHMTCKLDTGFGDDIARACNESIPNPLKGCAEAVCTLLERHSVDSVELVTLSAPSVLGKSSLLQMDPRSSALDAVGTADSAMKLKTGSVGWRQVSTGSEELEDLDKDSLQALVRAATIPPPNKKYPKNEQLINILKERKDKGATFMELLELSGLHATVLMEKLNRLASENIIKRVGFYENLIVLTKYTEPWSVDLGHARLIPSPWLTLDDSVNKPVFVKWCGAIVNTIFNYPGMTIAGLANQCEAITAKAVQEICVFLERCNCVKLEVIRETEPDLFSSDDAMDCDVFSEFDSPSCIFVLPVRDMLTRYSAIRKQILADLALM